MACRITKTSCEQGLARNLRQPNPGKRPPENQIIRFRLSISGILLRRLVWPHPHLLMRWPCVQSLGLGTSEFQTDKTVNYANKDITICGFFTTYLKMCHFVWRKHKNVKLIQKPTYLLNFLFPLQKSQTSPNKNLRIAPSWGPPCSPWPWDMLDSRFFLFEFDVNSNT